MCEELLSYDPQAVKGAAVGGSQLSARSLEERRVAGGLGLKLLEGLPF